MLIGVVYLAASRTAPPQSAPGITGSASPSSTSGGLDFVDYAVFLSHIETSQAQEQDNLNAVGDAYAAGGFDGAEGPASFYLGWSTVELAWLDANSPAPCFAQLHADWKATLVAYREAMNAFLAHDESLAESKIRAGTALMQRSSADLDAVSC